MSLMNLTECPVCNNRDFHEVLQVRNELVSRETFSIVECSHCSLRFTNPRPDNEALASYYQSEDYISHTNEANNLVDRLYKIARHFTLRSKRKIIQRGIKEKTLLDIGCGTGHFIAHCRDNNWQCIGVEPESGAREIASRDGLKVFATLGEIKDSSFDRITLWHVLEHLPDLTVSLAKINDLLKSNGKLFIAVPNYPAYEEKKFREHWAAYDVPRHLYHFTPQAMQLLVEKNGLKIDKAYPMWLDSFYISLLSNKHQFGRNKYVNSFITGLLSNIYAIKTRNFSSLIYQISKA